MRRRTRRPLFVDAGTFSGDDEWRSGDDLGGFIDNGGDGEQTSDDENYEEEDSAGPSRPTPSRYNLRSRSRHQSQTYLDHSSPNNPPTQQKTDKSPTHKETHNEHATPEVQGYSTRSSRRQKRLRLSAEKREKSGRLLVGLSIEDSDVELGRDDSCEANAIAGSPVEKKRKSVALLSSSESGLSDGGSESDQAKADSSGDRDNLDNAVQKKGGRVAENPSGNCAVKEEEMDDLADSSESDLVITPNRKKRVSALEDSDAEGSERVGGSDKAPEGGRCAVKEEEMDDLTDSSESDLNFTPNTKRRVCALDDSDGEGSERIGESNKTPDGGNCAVKEGEMDGLADSSESDLVITPNRKKRVSALEDSDAEGSERVGGSDKATCSRKQTNTPSGNSTGDLEDSGRVWTRSCDRNLCAQKQGKSPEVADLIARNRKKILGDEQETEAESSSEGATDVTSKDDSDLDDFIVTEKDVQEGGHVPPLDDPEIDDEDSPAKHIFSIGNVPDEVLFKIYLELLMRMEFDKDYLDRISQKNQGRGNIHLEAARKFDGRLCDTIDMVVLSQAHMRKGGSLLKTIESKPFLSHKHIDSTRHCQACNRKRNPASYKLTLYGPSYTPQWLSGPRLNDIGHNILSTSSNSDEESDDSVLEKRREAGKGEAYEILVGCFCCFRLLLFHAMTHFKRKIVEFVRAAVERRMKMSGKSWEECLPGALDSQSVTKAVLHCFNTMVSLGSDYLTSSRPSQKVVDAVLRSLKGIDAHMDPKSNPTAGVENLSGESGGTSSDSGNELETQEKE